MARILNFDDFLSKPELDRITEFAAKEFPAARELHDRAAELAKERNLKRRFEQASEPPKAA